MPPLPCLSAVRKQPGRPRRTRWWLTAAALRFLVLLVLAAPALALAEPRSLASESATRHRIEPAMLVLFNRDIVELRGSLGGLEPARRAERARSRFNSLTRDDLTQPAVLRPASLDEGSGISPTRVRSGKMK